MRDTVGGIGEEIYILFSASLMDMAEHSAVWEMIMQTEAGIFLEA